MTTTFVFNDYDMSAGIPIVNSVSLTPTRATHNFTCYGDILISNLYYTKWQ